MKKPFFSVIIPTFNRAAVLKNTLNFLVQQDFIDFEIIIVDDGGSDNTEQVLNEFKDSRIKYFRQENQGPLVARYFAVTKSIGSWLAFCDSDDIWTMDYLGTCYEAIAKYKTKVCFTDYQVEGEIGSRLKKLGDNGFFESSIIKSEHYVKVLDAMNFYQSLMITQPLMISSFMIERNYYESIGGIDNHLTVIGSEDAHLTQRAVGNTELVLFIDKNLVLLGRGIDNVSSSYIRNLEGGISILCDIESKKLVHPKLLKSTKQSISKHLVELAKQHYWQRNYNETLRVISLQLKYPSCYFDAFKILFKLSFRKIFSS